ncbi:MAG: RluA family pseudouridine synthase [Elusimicrobiota bacterium]
MSRKDNIKVEDNICVRLDKYLAKKTGFSRTKIKNAIESGLVKVNNELKSSHFRLSGGEKISYCIPEKEELSLKPQDIPIEVTYSDEYIAVINKQPGIVVHPGRGHRDKTILNGLKSMFESPILVHRLDKDTSGILIAALNEQSALSLRKQFKKRKVKKVYIALVEGEIEGEGGEISVPIKRSRRDPTRMGVGWSRAKESKTRYRVVEKLDNATYVEVYPLSGRTHQIRVHFSYIGHPVIGDKKYSSQKREYLAERQMLHSYQIAFEHPENKERLHFESPIPEDFKSVLNRIKGGSI